MKVLFRDYTFNPTSKTITFNTSNQILLSDVLLITNVIDNVIIYNFANPSLGGTMQNNILTLNYDTTSMSNSDPLQIFIETADTPASEETLSLLKRIAILLSPLSTQDSSNRVRVNIDTGTVTVSQPTAANLNAVVSQSTAANLNATVSQGTASNLNATVVQSTASNLNATVSVSSLGGVDPRFQIIDNARVAYATGIRSNLKNT